MVPLFYINSKNNIVLHKECYQIIPQLRKLKEAELLYIILMYDNYSPFRYLPVEDRLRTVKRHLFDDPDKDPENKKVKEAIDFYKSLQFSQEEEQIRGYRDRIKTLNKSITLEDNPQKIRQNLQSIEMLEDRIKNLQEKITFNVQQEKIKGGKSLSLLEQMHNNKQIYEMWHKETAQEIQVKPAWQFDENG